MKAPRYINAAVALTYDSKHDRVVKIVVSTDNRGRQWERYDGGAPSLIGPPPKRPQRTARTLRNRKV